MLRGQPAAALLDYLRRQPADLVVMCTHARSGVARWAQGSVADSLLRNGTAPVLLVRGVEQPDAGAG